MCGSAIVGKSYTVEIEGGLLTLCERCYRKQGSPPIVERKEIKVERKAKPRVNSRPKKVSPEELEVVEDYSKIIKEARERLKMDTLGLAKRLKVSENVVKRFESGRLKPTIDQARQLEKLLGVKLLVPTEVGEGVEEEVDMDITLGDVANVREGRK
ncbi:transcriptional regulator [Sulfodiicoccus acidiphilus]|uniref:Transcriptional regulator n=2 Tax=Sulfodiicoccus acidiphilus TaxID=1670455 RepID=A0A348B1C3_9CREN|nr:transcriptional regulator [Sulfodiicoccus acidiphilus]GGT91878.1 transcriptional regulator [Sulfodiicoccus acidiphilus]